MPSACSFVDGSGGTAPLDPLDRLREEMLALRAEKLDPMDLKDVRSLDMLLVLRTLLCVSVLRCPDDCASGLSGCTSITGSTSITGCTSITGGGVGALVKLGLRPSKGPGAMLSIRLIIFSPPFVRGLRGANKGLGGAYRWL
jgi:hypothetical protein